MTDRETCSKRDESDFSTNGHITAKTWSVTELRKRIKSWDVLDDDEKMARIQDLDGQLAEKTIETENIALDGLLVYIAQGLDPTDSANASTSHLALGTSTADPDPTDETLGEEVYRARVGDADVDTDSADLITSTLIGQTEANGNNITEIGLCGGGNESDPLLTHAVLDAADQFEKNTQMVVTINYVLELRRA